MNNMPYQKFHMKLRQSGQAFIFTLVFVAAAGLIGLLLFNSGLLANTKTRLQNAADAAAYSASVLQARDHNFSAYTNRAMVANQVAVAQIVSLKSFIEDAEDTGDRMGGFLLTMQRAIYPTNANYWDFIHNTAVPAVAILNSNFPSSASNLVKSLNLLIKVHMEAQQYHHISSIFDMPVVVDEVIKKNDPLAQASKGTFSAGNMTVQINGWSSSTKQHSANDSSKEADRFADVVVSENSTDRFVRNRGSTPNAFWYSGPANGVQPAVCLANPPPGAAVYTFSGISNTAFNFNHAGGTILSADKRKWEALDATQGSGFWSCMFTSCTYYFVFGAVTVPTCFSGGGLVDIGGSGGGMAGNGSGYGSSTGYTNNPGTAVHYGWALYSAAAIPANLRYADGPGSTLDSAGGLQNYYRDMSDPTKKIPKNQSPEENGGEHPITVEAERPASTLRTSSTFLQNSKIIKLDDQLASGRMRAMASAHAYFYRAKDNNGFSGGGWRRDDDRRELANLFNPYWQSRLTDISVTERSGSISEQAK